MASDLKSALYVVATPIGNLEDITLRAIKILSEVDVIACEDTRNTSILLEKYKIKTKLISYHKFSDNNKIELFLDYLKNNKSVALVSDAGTPLISDPGDYLIEQITNEGYSVIPITGACAICALLSAISRKSEDFKFIGFLPKIENKIIEIIKKNIYENLVFYESPKRLIATLEIIKENFPDKKIAIGRELTKKFEEIKVLNIDEMLSCYKSKTPKGEFALMLYKSKEREEENFDEKIKKLKKLNLKDKEISSILAQLYETNKNQIYKRCLELG